MAINRSGVKSLADISGTARVGPCRPPTHVNCYQCPYTVSTLDLYYGSHLAGRVAVCDEGMSDARSHLACGWRLDVTVWQERNHVCFIESLKL